jgi:hypothetical protein
MRKKLFLLCLFLFLLGWAQEEKTFGITFPGFVVPDVSLKSRETIDLRLYFSMLSPMNKDKNQDCNDLNVNLKYHDISMQTYMGEKLTGLNAKGVKPFAVMYELRKTEQLKSAKLAS